MYQRPRYYQGRRQFRPRDYVMPFVIIIFIGIALVLTFNLVRSFWGEENKQAAYMHIVQGSAQMKAWGTDQFFNLSSDVAIMEGDELRSSADARLIVEFFDGSIMRIDGGSDVSFDLIDYESKTPHIELKLIEGKVWFNFLYRNIGLSNFLVDLGNVRIRSITATVFELENKNDEIVRVIKVSDSSGLEADVLSEDGGKVVETETVGVGQQIVFDAAVLEKYRAYQSPTVLAALDDEFELNDWYKWNLIEDDKPTKFEKIGGVENVGLIKVEPREVGEEIMESENSVGGSGVSGVSGGSNVSDGSGSSGVSENSVVSGVLVDEISQVTLKKPTITSVAGGTQLDAQGRYKVTGKVATLTGSIEGADKVVVNGYTLEKFKFGDKTWTYYANADYNLMKPGDNVYEIYALDSKGNKSEILTIKVLYEPPLVQPVKPTDENTSEVTGASENSDENNVPSD